MDSAAFDLYVTRTRARYLLIVVSHDPRVLELLEQACSGHPPGAPTELSC